MLNRRTGERERRTGFVLRGACCVKYGPTPQSEVIIFSDNERGPCTHFICVGFETRNEGWNLEEKCVFVGILEDFE
jgi:hypothetical protein